MAKEHIIGIRLTANNTEVVGAINEVVAAQDKLAHSARALGTEAKQRSLQDKAYWKNFQQEINDRAQESLRAEAAADSARDKAWALANGYKEVDGQIIKVAQSSGVSLGKLGLNTQYARREMMQLGKEAVMGDFSQMPRTFAALATHSNLLPALISPIGLAVAGVTAAVVAGGLVWNAWGKSAEEASNRAVTALKDAEQHAKTALAGVSLTPTERLTVLDYKLQSARGSATWATQQAARRDTNPVDAANWAKAAGKYREEIAALERQKSDIEEQIAKADDKIGQKFLDKDAKLAQTHAKESAQAQAKAIIIDTEIRENVRLTESQKKLIELSVEYTTKNTGLTQSEYNRQAANLGTVAAMEVEAQAQKALTNEINTAQEAQQKEVRTAQESMQKQLEHNAVIGQSSWAMMEMTASRLDDAAATDEQNASYLDTLALDGEIGKFYQNRADELRELAKAKRGEAAGMRQGAALDSQAKTAEAAKAEWKKVFDSIEGGFKTAFTNVLTGSKSVWLSLRDLFKSIFIDYIYASLAKPFVVQLIAAGASMMGASGLANAAQSAMGSTLGSGATGAAGAAAGAGIFGSVGSGAVSAVGPAIPVAGTGFLGGWSGTAAAGSGTAASIGSMAATVAPIAIAAAGVYALAKYGFGFGNERENVGDQRLTGQFSRQGFQGNFAQDWKKDGGWFGSDERGTTLTAVNSLQSKAFKTTVDTLQSTFNTLGREIGDTRVQTRDWVFNVNQAGDVTSALADSMALQLVPELEKFRLTGEDLAKTAQRMTTTFQSTSYFMNALGLSSEQAFGAIGILSAKARTDLINLFSGTDTATKTQDFNSKVAGFSQNFLTPEQRVQPALAAVGNTFNELNITDISTNQEFAQRVKDEMVAAGSSATEALKLQHLGVVEKLLSVADAFNTVTSSAKTTTDQLLAMVKESSFKSLVDYKRAQSYASQGIATNVVDGVSSAASLQPQSLTSGAGAASAIATATSSASGATAAPASPLAAPATTIAAQIAQATSSAGVTREKETEVNQHLADVAAFRAAVSPLQGRIAELTAPSEDNGDSRSTLGKNSKLAKAQAAVQKTTNVTAITNLQSTLTSVSDTQITAASAARAAAKVAAFDALQKISAKITDPTFDGEVRRGGSAPTIANPAYVAAKQYFDALPAFEVGTNYLPHDMVAHVHEGERIIPKADNVQLMSRLREPVSNNNDALLTEMQAMRAEIKLLRENQTRDNAQIKSSTKSTADLLDNISGGGGPLLVQTA